MAVVVGSPVGARVSARRVSVLQRVPALRGAASRRAVAGGFAVAGALGLAGCTLQNETHDTDANQVPSNIYRDRSSDRSIELWNSPGENLLAAVAEVEQNDKTSVRPQNNRILGQILAESGAYFSALTAYQPFGDTLERQEEECNSSILPDAVEDLCARLADDPDDPEDQAEEQLVFISALDHAPAQTTLMRKILSCAMEHGFTYLAVEALQEDASALVARGHVSFTQSGPLTREPQMAGLLEDALGLGYQVVNYDVAEHCLSCGRLEEITRHGEQQATNLVARTIGVERDAKVLVLAGPRQAYKEAWGPNAPYTTSLASRVWTQTNIEPYAVEQVEIDLPAMPFGASSPTPPSGMYLASGPNNGQCMGQYSTNTENGGSALNTVIVHVPPQTDVRRWDWLHAAAEERRTVTATCAACTAGQRLLVQAFPTGIDVADRVPTDQALCQAGAGCQLVLPAGGYQVVVWSETARLGSAEVDLSSATAGAVSL